MMSIKVAVVGPGKVGKTTLIARLSGQNFPEEYLSVFDNYSVGCSVSGRC